MPARAKKRGKRRQTFTVFRETKTNPGKTGRTPLGTFTVYGKTKAQAKRNGVAFLKRKTTYMYDDQGGLRPNTRRTNRRKKR